MKDTVAYRYALALYDLAKETNKIDIWQEQMRLVKIVFVKDRSLKTFFDIHQISKEDKKNILKKAFVNDVDKEVLNFMCLLVDRYRLNHISDIASAFNTLCNEGKNIIEGLVYSTYELSDEDITKVEEVVGAKLSQKVELHNVIDERLIKGIKVVVNDMVIDDSMRYKLNSLRDELLKETR